MADFVEKSARYKDDRSMRQMELLFLKGLMDKKRLKNMKQIASEVSERSFNFWKTYAVIKIHTVWSIAKLSTTQLTCFQ